MDKISGDLLAERLFLDAVQEKFLGTKKCSYIYGNILHDPKGRIWTLSLMV